MACPLLIDGVPDPTGTVFKRPATRIVREIFAEMEASGKPHYLEARKALDDIFEVLGGSVTDVLSGRVPDQFGVPPQRMKTASQLAQRLITQGERQAEFSAGLALLGIGKNLETLSQCLSLIIKLVDSGSDRMVLQRTWNAVSNMYRWLWKNNSTGLPKVRPPAAMRRGIGRSLRARRNNDLRSSLANMMDAGVRFRKIAELSLAA
jgi:hypothetical protein